MPQGLVTFASALSATILNALWEDALLVLCIALLLRLRCDALHRLVRDAGRCDSGPRHYDAFIFCVAARDYDRKRPVSS